MRKLPHSPAPRFEDRGLRIEVGLGVGGIMGLADQL